MDMLIVIIVSMVIMGAWTAFWGLIPPFVTFYIGIRAQKKAMEYYVKAAEGLERKIMKRMDTTIDNVLNEAIERIFVPENMDKMRKSLMRGIRAWYGALISAQIKEVEEMTRQGKPVSFADAMFSRVNQRVAERFGIPIDVRDIVEGMKEAKGDTGSTGSGSSGDGIPRY